MVSNTEQSSYEESQKYYAECRKKWEKDAAALEPEAIGRLSEIFLAAQKEQKDQFDGFSCEAVRLGSFMIIKTTRRANPEGEQVFSTAINLSLVTRIQLIPGHDVDRNGILYYKTVYFADNKDEVAPAYPPIPRGRLPWEEETKKSAEGYYAAGGHSIQFHTTQYVRAAQDDRIHFFGLDSALFVPFGWGERVHHILLATT